MGRHTDLLAEQMSPNWTLPIPWSLPATSPCSPPTGILASLAKVWSLLTGPCWQSLKQTSLFTHRPWCMEEPSWETDSLLAEATSAETFRKQKTALKTKQNQTKPHPFWGQHWVLGRLRKTMGFFSPQLIQLPWFAWDLHKQHVVFKRPLLQGPRLRLGICHPQGSFVPPPLFSSSGPLKSLFIHWPRRKAHKLWWRTSAG